MKAPLHPYNCHIFTLSLLITGLPLLSPHAIANENVDDIERIIVTGSRISRTDIETASPVTIVSADYIAKSGFNSLEDVLSAQSIVAGMNLGATSNNGSGGSATVNLRGMGENRTLVLLNGRRMVPSGVGADSSVDLNTIPLSMIKSVEILKDGASAVYGSDAIAGVVNILTYKSFEGSELYADYDITDKGDGALYSASFLHGIDIGQGNLVIGLQYSGRDKIIQSDRDYVSPGCSYFIPGGLVDGLAPNGNGGFEYVAPCYDYTASSYLQTPNDLYSLFSSYNNDLSDNVELSFDLLYTHRDSSQQLAPEPALLFLDTFFIEPSYLAFFDDEEFGVPYYLEYARRMTDAGPRKTTQHTDTYRASFAVKGYLDSGAAWDISATYGRNDATEKTFNSIHAVNMEESIYNHQALWFSGDLIDQSFLSDEGVVYTDTTKGGNEQFVLSAGFNGETEYSLGYAMGVESRWESGFYTPDRITQLGLGMSAQSDATDGRYNVQSAYAEVSYPIIDALKVDAALRYDHYSTFGGELTWKVGATYRVNEQLMLRSVAATGFRAPNVNELFGGDFGSYEFIYDPWYDEEYETLLTYKSAQNLKPEESDSLTLGLVWDISRDFSTTVDYWRFKTKNAIGSPDLQASVNACFEQDLAACNKVNITADGDLSEIESPLININDQKIAGIDWNLNYSTPHIDISLDTTYMLDFIEDGYQYVGWIDGIYGDTARIRSNLSAQADISEQISVLYGIEYIHGLDGEFAGETFSTHAVTYHRVSMTYQHDEQLALRLGLTNLFDKKPEHVPGGDDMDTVPSTYDVIGRAMFVSAQYNF